MCDFGLRRAFFLRFLLLLLLIYLYEHESNLFLQVENFKSAIERV